MHRLGQPPVAELLVVGVARLDDAVGVEGQEVAGAQPGAALEVLRRLEHPDGDPAAPQLLDGAVGAHQERRLVAGVDVDQLAGRHVEHGVEEGDVAPGVDRIVEEPVGVAHDRADGQLAPHQRVHRGADGGHLQGGGDALAGHVGDDDAPAVVRQRDELVVVAPHLERRLVDAGDVEPL